MHPQLNEYHGRDRDKSDEDTTKVKVKVKSKFDTHKGHPQSYHPSILRPGNILVHGS